MSEQNGNRPSMATEAIQALAEETAARQSADERWIARVDDNVARVADSLEAFQTGKTPWQVDVTAKLATLSNHVLALTAARIVRPGLTSLIALGLGGLAAELIWRLVNR